jgi:dTDP-4-dehydrorhamnose 3,5-epimerase
MIIEKTAIPEVLLITPRVFEDDRGFFMETWSQKAFQEQGLDLSFVQDNHSKSVKGTLRGLHYQIQNPQGKLVRVTQGEVFDVAVDMRKASSTFGKWVGVALSEHNKQLLWIPPGFAHGFYVMSHGAQLQYKCTDIYNPSAERTIIYNDETIGINWPLDGTELILSQKDLKGLKFIDSDTF